MVDQGRRFKYCLVIFWYFWPRKQKNLRLICFTSDQSYEGHLKLYFLLALVAFAKVLNCFSKLQLVSHSISPIYFSRNIEADRLMKVNSML